MADHSGDPHFQPSKETRARWGTQRLACLGIAAIGGMYLLIDFAGSSDRVGGGLTVQLTNGRQLDSQFDVTRA